MSDHPASNNDRAIEYPPCVPWCEFGRGTLDMDGHNDYCLRGIGPVVMARTEEDAWYEITASQAHLRLPIDTSSELQGHANQYHRMVIQLVAIPHNDETKILRLNIQPSNARSLAAILTRAADLTEGLT